MQHKAAIPPHLETEESTRPLLARLSLLAPPSLPLNHNVINSLLLHLSLCVCVCVCMLIAVSRYTGAFFPPFFLMHMNRCEFNPNN